MFDWQFALEILPQLARAAVVTIEATFVGFALAAVLGLVLAILRRSENPWISMITGGFVEFIRSTPVLIQIFYYKSTGGKRFFLCAPVHHHFHLSGWTETQTVVRFWLVAALFAAFALATIKLR